MKTKMFAKDSENLIVIDDTVKVVPAVKVFLTICGLISLGGLTAYGLIGGATSPFMLNKYEEIDRWTEHPDSQRLLAYYGGGLLVVVLLTIVLYWVYKMFSK